MHSSLTQKKIKALGNDIYGFALQGKEIETDAYWYYSLWTHGGELIEGGKSGVASAGAIEALALYRSLIDQGLTEPDPTGYNRQDIERLFKQGRIGMILTGPWLRGQMKTDAPDLSYGIAPIPAGSTKATYGVTDDLMVFKSSQQKKLAWQLTETAFAPKWRIEFTTKEGFLPVTKVEAEQPQFVNDPQLKAFTEMRPMLILLRQFPIGNKWPMLQSERYKRSTPVKPSRTQHLRKPHPRSIRYYNNNKFRCMDPQFDRA